jgi:CheY-like chemotaxis protein
MSAPTLLIVDDDAQVRDALSRWFELRGFVVDTAVDGYDAIERCREKRFDVITLDIEMPRISGLDALPPIRELLPDARIVVLTGYPRGAEEALARGAVKVLVKPMRLTALEEEIRQALGEVVVPGDAAGA